MSNRPRTIQPSGIPFFSPAPRLLLPVSGLALVRHRDHGFLLVRYIIYIYIFFFFKFFFLPRDRSGRSCSIGIDWNNRQSSRLFLGHFTSSPFFFYVFLPFFITLRLVYFTFRLTFLLSLSLSWFVSIK